MLEIIDINTSSECLDEVLKLKKSFQTCLHSVKYGTVIIISNFPGPELIDYLIIVNIERKNGNYYRIRYNNSIHYVDNIILGILKYSESDIIGVDSANLYGSNSSFNYKAANWEFNKELKNYLENFQNSWCYTQFQVTTDDQINYLSPKLLLNEELTADRILSSFAYQQVKQFPKVGRIRAFPKKFFEDKGSEKIKEFVKSIISKQDEKFEYGILTKKKLDLIASRKNKIVDDIHEHIGNSINIISGKAGTGKTIYLAKSIYRLIGNNHRARFLTFNHALVKDMRCTLRGYGNFTLSNFSASTIHKYFFKLAKEMGISLILGEERVNELVSVCSMRFDKFRPTFDKIKNKPNFSEKNLLDDVISREKDKSNYPEFRAIAKYFMSVNDFRNWQKLKDDYLRYKKQLLSRYIGSKVFIEDYPKVLETLYLSITNTEKFYDDFNIKNRYELLSFIYKIDKHPDGKIIPYPNVEKQVKKIKKSANWSIIFIDEAQDCEQYEKEILFELRGSENIVVASGGKEQLIRSSGLRLWNLSNGRKIPFNLNKLYGSSHRQKENIIQFVNKMAIEYAIDLKLKSHVSSKGTGKIILNLRNNSDLYDVEQINNLLNYGIINECSVYESLMILVTANYINYESNDSFKVDVTDYVKRVSKSSNKTLKGEELFEKNSISIWNGITEKKSELQIPFQNQTRVIPYDSCRGLEAWSVMCLDLDGFIKYKRETEQAKEYLADDLFLSEEDRKDKYALTWLLMAFTRPIDTLYLDLSKRESPISKKIVEICRKLEGVEIIE